MLMSANPILSGHMVVKLQDRRHWSEHIDRLGETGDTISSCYCSDICSKILKSLLSSLIHQFSNRDPRFCAVFYCFCSQLPKKVSFRDGRFGPKVGSN